MGPNRPSLQLLPSLDLSSICPHVKSSLPAQHSCPGALAYQNNPYKALSLQTCLSARPPLAEGSLQPSLMQGAQQGRSPLLISPLPPAQPSGEAAVPAFSVVLLTVVCPCQPAFRPCVLQGAVKLDCGWHLLLQSWHWCLTTKPGSM